MHPLCGNLHQDEAARMGYVCLRMRSNAARQAAPAPEALRPTRRHDLDAPGSAGAGAASAPGADPAAAAGLAEARAKLTLSRMRYLAAVLLPVALGHLAYFAWPSPPGLGAAALTWRRLLLEAHALHLALLAATAALAWAAWRHRDAPLRWRAALPAGAALLFIQLVAWIASFDQLVTSAVTPYVLGSLVVAVVFRLSAPWGLAVHGLGCASLSAGLLLYQHAPGARASGLLNAFTVSVVSFAIGLALTRAFDEAELARSTIARQRAELDQLRGLLHVCAWCKRVRSDDAGWEAMESYVARHSDAQLTHGMCERCCTEHFGHLPISLETQR